MGSFSLVHWLVVALVVLVLFGRGRISETMGDFGKGIKSFRKGLAEDDSAKTDAATPVPPQQIPAAKVEAPVQTDTTPKV